MVYSIFIIRKAQQFGIDLNNSMGILWVCKHMLDGLWAVFADDPYKAVANIRGIEEELRELKNVLILIRRSRMSVSFISAGYITSIDEILRSVQEAHALIGGAYIASVTKQSTIDLDTDITRNFNYCQEQIDKALQGFRLG